MQCGCQSAQRCSQRCLLMPLGHEPVLVEHALHAAFGVNPLPPFRQVLAVAAASLGKMGSVIAVCSRGSCHNTAAVDIARQAEGESKFALLDRFELSVVSLSIIDQALIVLAA